MVSAIDTPGRNDNEVTGNGDTSSAPRATLAHTDTERHAGAHLSLEEHRKHGGVAMGIYMSYFDFARPGRGGALLGMVVASYIGSQMIRVRQWWSVMCDAEMQV